MDVYFYVGKQDKDRILECGLKLSEWASRKIFILGIRQDCICTLLNPMDDMEKFNDDNYTPIKIKVNPKATIIAEGIFYDEDIYNKDMRKLYNDSVTAFDKYVFGTYRRPECLLTGTVDNKFIDEMDVNIDVPVLYSSSEELYIEKQMELGKEFYSSFEEKLLYRYYKHLSELNLYKTYSSLESDFVIFEREDAKHIVSLKKI